VRPRRRHDDAAVDQLPAFRSDRLPHLRHSAAISPPRCRRVGRDSPVTPFRFAVQDRERL